MNYYSYKDEIINVVYDVLSENCIESGAELEGKYISIDTNTGDVRMCGYEDTERITRSVIYCSLESLMKTEEFRDWEDMEERIDELFNEEGLSDLDERLSLKGLRPGALNAVESDYDYEYGNW